MWLWISTLMGIYFFVDRKYEGILGKRAYTFALMEEHGRWDADITDYFAWEHISIEVENLEFFPQ
jgi:hypothetical protein